MSTIRERDIRKRGGPKPAWMTQTERDRRALLAALDALVKAVRPVMACIEEPAYFPIRDYEVIDLRAALIKACEVTDE